MPKGVSWKSSAYCKFMRDYKKPIVDPVFEKYSTLKECWNRIPRRYGDEAIELGADGKEVANQSWAHGNTYSMKSTVKAAFCEIGSGTRHSTGAVSIDSNRRGLVDIVNTACLAARLMQEFAYSIYDKIRGPPGDDASNSEVGVCVVRNFDGTPGFFRFGSLASRLLKHSRQLIKVEPEDENRYAYWKTVSYEEYKRRYPRSNPEMGILEILATKAEVSWGTMGQDANGRPFPETDRQEFISPPQVIQKANASTCLSAIDTAPKAYYLQQIKDLSKCMG